MRTPLPKSPPLLRSESAAASAGGTSAAAAHKSPDAPESQPAPRSLTRALHAKACAFSHRFGARLGLALLVVAILCTAAAHLFEREWAHWLGKRTPISWVQSASADTLQRLDRTVLRPTAVPASRQNAINSQFAALKVPGKDRPLYELVFRGGGALGARSFTLAGGQIVVTDEWLASFQDDRALLTALTVQLGHLQNGDALRSAVDRAPVRMLTALLKGDAVTGTRLMSQAQPVLQHDAHCEEEAQAFSRAVMLANP